MNKENKELIVVKTTVFDKIKKLLKTPIIFDGRNQYSRKSLEESGFTYFSIGNS